MRRMAKAAKVPWPLVVLLIRFIEAFLAAVARRGSQIPTLDPKVLEPALLAVTPICSRTRGRSGSGRRRAAERLNAGS